VVRLLGPGSGLSHQAASIADRSQVDAAIAAARPEVVFNCAAYNAVDRAEAESNLAYEVNAQGPLNLAMACSRNGSMLVHFSTNFVFDGAKDGPYVETDEPAPISVYGSSKLAGERSVLESGARVLVIRTAAVFGRGANFPTRILERASSGEPLRVVSDQKVNPTYAKDLAQAALELAGGGVTGLVHAVADGCTSWDDYARAVLEELGVAAPVESVPTAAFPTAARRPLNGCLASARYRSLRPWREALHEYVTEVLQAPPQS
jgi:dTDP-4-dehydrorhamnose reductase